MADLDILAVASDPTAAMDRLGQFAGVEVLARGGTKMTVRLADGLQVDLRVVPAESFGAALQYFTGSKDHNVVLRGLAKSRGLKINEYGVFRVTPEGETYIAGRTEDEVYSALNLPAFPPEIREARFEFAWAEAGPLPHLVELGDLRGDLHMHTTATDGRASLEEMIEAARRRGLAYIAITDHSKRVSMANGLDEQRLLAQWAEIDRLNATLGDFRVLKGVEVDILERGGLDINDECLSQADWVVASVHYGQNQPREQITARILGALENPHVSAIAHPTGRLINRRAAYEVDLDAVFKAAAAQRQMPGDQRQPGPAGPGRCGLRRGQVPRHTDRDFNRRPQHRWARCPAIWGAASPAGRFDRCRRAEQPAVARGPKAASPRLGEV